MSSPLISAAELAQLLAGDAPPTVLDVRWRLGGPPGRETFAAGHVPGARYVDLDTDLADPPGERGRHPLPAPDRFVAAMRRVGVRRDRTVAVMDDGDATAAARLWWLLRYYGHPDVRVLDGGFRAWQQAGGAVETGEPADSAPDAEGDVTGTPGGLPVLDADAAATLARRGVLLDARAAERYRGEVEPVDPVAGHVPGAVNAPTTANVDPDGRLLPPAALRERFAALGVRPGVEVGAYCGSGVTAAHEVLALAVAGVDAALYPGSWSEWVRDPARPVATGADPG